MTTSSAERALLELDLYRLLDPTNTLSAASLPADISRHYRKQARLLHPDKNPNNPHAAEQFDTLQRAYELLTDETRRGEYDDRQRKREEKKRKAESEDARVRVMRERLEERERAGKAGWDSNKRQMQAARIQRENEAVIAQLRHSTTPPQPPQAPHRAERRGGETKQAEVEAKRANQSSTGVTATHTSAGLDMAAYETSTLERMREMARRRKAEKERAQQPPAHAVETHTSTKSPHSAAQHESEVIVLDDASGAVT